ncbi:MAG: hypothetical protein JWP27_175 [Flaviaesturariibacter sp.]|nr:hypothetical protein [Flaviaesturariibacter sp.]
MNPKDQRHDADWQRTQPTYDNPADATPRREGGDDALAEASPTDPADDQKVLVNDPRKATDSTTQDTDSKDEGDPDGKLAD